MLKFDSDTVTGLGPGTRADVLAQRTRSQRFWQENKERRQSRLEQRAAAETYRREEEAKRDCRDDPVQRRVAARLQASGLASEAKPADFGEVAGDVLYLHAPLDRRAREKVFAFPR